MALNRYTLLAAAAGMIALSSAPGYAREAGDLISTKPGALIGASAGVPPPGVYMFNQDFTVQANLGNLERDLMFGFTEPYLFDRPLQFGFTVYGRRFIYDQARQAAILTGQARVDLNLFAVGLEIRHFQPPEKVVEGPLADGREFLPRKIALLSPHPVE